MLSNSKKYKQNVNRTFCPSRYDAVMACHYLITDIVASLDITEATLRQTTATLLKVPESAIKNLKIARQAVDARHKRAIHFLLNLEVQLEAALPLPLPKHVNILTQSQFTAQPPPSLLPSSREKRQERIIIVGAGPAGLFSALTLAEAGFSITLLERGKPVETRMRDIGQLRAHGQLNPESNTCFGEGGAGTYTDGKLYTRIKHPFVRWVMHELVKLGAPEQILVDAHPHLGTDKLVSLLKNLRARLLAAGVDYRFETRVDKIMLAHNRIQGVVLGNGEELTATRVILATGHSARAIYEHLADLGVPLEAKPFAVGVRAEHPQALINTAQHGAFAAHPRLGAAEYRLAHQALADPTAQGTAQGMRGVYSFCMCPGGLIVPSSTEPKGMVINGMSNAKRSARYANSGLVAQVYPHDLVAYGNDALRGLRFQRELEQRAYAMTQIPYHAPAMRLTDFLKGKSSSTLAPTEFRPGAEAADLCQLFPAWLTHSLREGITAFSRKLRGYDSSEANLFAVESRTSAPLSIPRDQQLQCIGIRGLYPAGEGAGQAGGIVSAAVDGLKIAEVIIQECT